MKSEARVPYTERSLADLALAESARELSEVARSLVPTGPRGHETPGARLGDALQLLALAEYLVRDAAVAERLAGSSWAQLGEVAEISRSSAHERWSGAVAAWDRRYQQGMLDDIENGGYTAAATERATHLDRWMVRHNSDSGQTPVTDRLEPMAPLTESIHLSRVRGVLLEQHFAPPAHLMLPIAERQAELDDILAETAEPDMARELRHAAERSRAYARDLAAKLADAHESDE